MISQAGIVVFGVAAIYLSQDPRESMRKWASVAGLCAQPFWYASSFIAEQWGIFAISFVYTAAWARGFHHFWIKPLRAVA